MARLLYVILNSTDAPERAATALYAAARSSEAGHEVALWLQDEGVRLGVEAVAETFREPGPGSAPEHLAALVERGGRLYLSRRCFAVREFEEDQIRRGGVLADPEALGALVDEGWIPVAT